MKKRTGWLFVDLIEDKIKNRGLFITISLLFYVYLTWKFIVGVHEVDTQPNRIESSLEFSHLAIVGEDISSLRSPQIKIVNANGDALEGVTVTLRVTKVSMETDKKIAPI